MRMRLYFSQLMGFSVVLAFLPCEHLTLNPMQIFCCDKKLLSQLHCVAALVYYRPQRSCGQGNVFTGVCDSVNRGGLPQCMLGYHPPRRRTSPRRTPQEGEPPQKETPPRRRTPHKKENPPRRRTPQEADPLPQRGRRSMSSQYASYWNAFLFKDLFTRCDYGLFLTTNALYEI